MNTLLAPEPLIFVDLETSGANFANDRIIEIGLIEVDADGAREWSVLVNPERPISSFITGLTGIDDAMVDAAPPFRELAPALLDRLRGRLFIAHNARFDYGFLKSEFSALGMDFRSPNLCTVKLSRKLFPQHYRHNLDTLVERHGLSVAGDRHRALADARVLWDLWQCWHRLLPVDAIRDAVTTIVGRPHLPRRSTPRCSTICPKRRVPMRCTVRTIACCWSGAAATFASRCWPTLRSATATRYCSATPGESSGVTPPANWVRVCGRSNSPARRRLATRHHPPRVAARASAWRLQSSVRGNSGSLRRVTSDRNSFFHRTSILLWPTTCSASTRIVARPCAALRTLADAQRLCPQQLGLEDGAKAGACTAYRQKNCRGVCIGKETVGLHSVRLMTALAKLKVKAWPYKGPVLLIEQDEFGMREDHHLVDRWRLLARYTARIPCRRCSRMDPSDPRLRPRDLPHHQQISAGRQGPRAPPAPVLTLSARWLPDRPRGRQPCATSRQCRCCLFSVPSRWPSRRARWQCSGRPGSAAAV